MRTIFLIVLLFFPISAISQPAQAQQPEKIPRIAWLTGGTIDEKQRESFLSGLRELGYIEGKNIHIEWRGLEGRRDRVTAMAEELVRQKVEIIITASASDTRATKAATTTVPIVMTNDGDPVGNGFVASLARPGGNITGLSTLSPELAGKRIDLLREIIPKLSRLADFGTSNSATNARELKEVESAAAAAGVTVQYFDILAIKEAAPTFQAAAKARAQAVLWLVSGGVLPSSKAPAEARKSKTRLPVISGSSLYVEVGGFMSYGVNLNDLKKRAAYYVDKILKGAKPADLPVEQPTKFEFLINLKTANEIGLTIPPSVLARADRVIK